MKVKSGKEIYELGEDSLITKNGDIQMMSMNSKCGLSRVHKRLSKARFNIMLKRGYIEEVEKTKLGTVIYKLTLAGLVIGDGRLVK